MKCVLPAVIGVIIKILCLWSRNLLSSVNTTSCPLSGLLLRSIRCHEIHWRLEVWWLCFIYREIDTDSILGRDGQLCFATTTLPPTSEPRSNQNKETYAVMGWGRFVGRSERPCYTTSYLVRCAYHCVGISPLGRPRPNAMATEDPRVAKRLFRITRTLPEIYRTSRWSGVDHRSTGGWWGGMLLFLVRDMWCVLEK